MALELKPWGENFYLLEELGAGGMGMVYLGYHKPNKQLVAIKTLFPEMATDEAMVLRFNRDHVGDKYAMVRQAMGLSPDQDLAEVISALNADLGLPANLREMGVRDEHIPALAKLANADHTNATNPRPAGVADYVRLFEEAMG